MMAAAMLSPVKLMKLAMNPLEEELDGLVGHAWKLAGLLWPILAFFCIGLVGWKSKAAQFCGSGGPYLEIGRAKPIVANVSNFSHHKNVPKIVPKNVKKTWGRSSAQQILIQPWWGLWLLLCPSWCRQGGVPNVGKCTKCRQIYQI